MSAGNLDFFNKVRELHNVNPVGLLGEVTFHQLHDGTAVKVPVKDHPRENMAEEYQNIRGKLFEPHFIPDLFRRYPFKMLSTA